MNPKTIPDSQNSNNRSPQNLIQNNGPNIYGCTGCEMHKITTTNLSSCERCAAQSFTASKSSHIIPDNVVVLLSSQWVPKAFLYASNVEVYYGNNMAATIIFPFMYATILAGLAMFLHMHTTHMTENFFGKTPRGNARVSQLVSLNWWVFLL